MPLHPAAKEFLKQLAASDAPGWSELGPVRSREVFNGLADLWGTGPECAAVQDFRTDTGVLCRSYRPSDEARLPAVLYFHGGGWVLGNIETHDALCRRLAQASRRCVIAVDYRLAPEARYPAASDDCYQALQQISSQAEGLGVDPERLAVAGDSAGGNLAAAVCLRARDEQGPAIDCQALIYPVIEPDFESQSYQAYAEGHSLTRAAMAWFWEQYLGKLDEGTVKAAKYAALGSAELAGLPRALVLTAEYDVLRSEAEDFATRLQEAGNEVDTQRFAGMLHGFVHLAGVFGDGLKAIERVGDFLRTK